MAPFASALSSDDQKGLSVAEIGVMVFGILFFLATISCLTWFGLKSKCRSQRRGTPPSSPARRGGLIHASASPTPNFEPKFMRTNTVRTTASENYVPIYSREAVQTPPPPYPPVTAHARCPSYQTANHAPLSNPLVVSPTPPPVTYAPGTRRTPSIAGPIPGSGRIMAVAGVHRTSTIA
ncbi:hypothetical protein C8Q76DRAFT_698280 [Earliella scabrosa]|nr:hypothetical protein C8Q76DRAFT_698280 [Earliella scabrosa]